MNGRLLGTELKRSAAPWPGLVVLAGSLAIFFLIDGIWWRGTAGWTAHWTPMALWTRSWLLYWWPLAAGFGAVYGLRESRSRMTELVATTPRPAWRRATLSAAAMAIPLASGFGLLTVVGAVRVALGPTTYLPLGWLPISLVAVLALVAAAVFGMGIARAVPSVLTPPALVLSLLMTCMLLQQNAEEKLPSAPGRFALLSPATAQPRQMLLTLSASVDLGQALWLLGLLTTGLALLSAAGKRARLLAAIPALAGAVLALLVFPADVRDTYVVDKAAAAMVCDGPVCVTRANSSHLPELAAHGREALRRMRDALGEQAPTEIRENTGLRALGDHRELTGGVVLVDFDDPLIAEASGDGLTRVLVAQGLVPNCAARTPWESGGLADVPVQSIAASWALGDHRLQPLRTPDAYSQLSWENAEASWAKLPALPAAEQRSRIALAHAAALSCQDKRAALTGETSP
ncbi:hypothetical protein AB0D08_16000 [Kitasatospora sp. NPDC048540]|uniref:hypothetical protein n=1 Tax=Kitasatospora sp. NPDC048540 TaxID=3155634 RepID=UPI0033C05BE0